MVTMGLLVVVFRRTPQVRAILADRRTFLLLAAAALIVTVNWATYIYGVNNDKVVETSLGYFINPLVTVLMGVFILGERLRPLQWVAMGVASLAVVVLTVDYGRLPYIALVLAFSFGTYGLLKKTANVGALESLAVETTVVAPLAVVYLGWLVATGASTFGTEGSGARAAARLDRHRHRRPADLLRRRRHPGPDDHPRPAPVPRAGAPVRARRVRAGRGHARVPLDRLRAGLDRAGDLHRRGDQPPPPPAAG